MACTLLKDLKNMSDEEIEELHDCAMRDGIVNEAKYYADEMNWRKQERQTELLKKFTICIMVMTGIMTLSTITNVILFFSK